MYLSFSSKPGRRPRRAWFRGSPSGTVAAWIMRNALPQGATSTACKLSTAASVSGRGCCLPLCRTLARNVCAWDNSAAAGPIFRMGHLLCGRGAQTPSRRAKNSQVRVQALRYGPLPQGWLVTYASRASSSAAVTALATVCMALGCATPKSGTMAKVVSMFCR